MLSGRSFDVNAGVIDAYFRRQNYFPHIPYEDVGDLIRQEAWRASLDLPLACALVEQESGGKLLFGCDWGIRWTNRPPFCQVKVTKARVKALLRNIDEGGGANGVGLLQLTAPELVWQAERLGGAHLPRYQLRVGFSLLSRLLATYPYEYAIGAYNGGESNPQFDYADEVIALRNQWRERLSDE